MNENIDLTKKEKALSQANEHAWLYLVSDVLTWKDGIGQYLDDPRVQELAKKLCSEYAQKLYNPFEVKKENMEERTLKISFEKAKEFYQKGGEFRILALSAFTEEELTKIELPKTWEEFCKRNKVKEGEYFSNEVCDIMEAGIGERHKSFDKNTLPNKQAAEQHLALMQLHQLRDCYRKGWIPNYTNDSKQWCIKKYANYFSIDLNHCGMEFLSFQSRELADQFLTNFKDLIEKAGDLI